MAPRSISDNERKVWLWVNSAPFLSTQPMQSVAKIKTQSIHSLSAEKESGQVYWSKCYKLPINCMILKLNPAWEPPQITPHPEGCSQCSGRAPVSGHRPRQWNISHHNDGILASGRGPNMSQFLQQNIDVLRPRFPEKFRYEVISDVVRKYQNMAKREEEYTIPQTAQ